MKKLFFLLFVLCALATFARATDVTIGATTIPGFYAASLPADVTVSPVSVTFGSPTVTSAGKFSSWVGLGGFRISINGVAYTVAYVSSASSLTLTTNYAGGDSSGATVIWYKYVELRLYADSSFQPLGKTYIVQPGTVGSGAWYRRVAASIVNESPGINNLYIPQLVLDSTTDSLTNQSARYYAAFYRPGGAFIQTYDCFESFSLQPTGSTTWPDICLYNQRQVIVQNDTVYTKAQVDSFRTGCTIGQSLYYAVTGLKPDCLNFGTGLQLIGNTLSATAGTSYQTILNNGTPLTQRTSLNFQAPSFIASDGGTRTNVDADSDLNALASNATNGFWAAGTSPAARTLTGTANEIAITNGNGTGTPVFSLPSALTFTGKTITSGVYGGITGFGIRSTGGGPFDFQLNNTETLTANRTLTVTLNDANRTLNLAGNLTTAGANPITFTSTGSTNITLPTSGIVVNQNNTETLTNKTLTSPRIGTSILDVNGNTFFNLTATGSAVNFLTYANAVAGGSPSLNPTGASTDINFIITPKGAGKIAVGTPGASPVAGRIGGPDATGTNTAGADLEIAGGPGTGNAAQGLATFRYPLTTSSGSSLQALTTASFPPWTNMHLRNNGDVTVANTTTETSILGASQSGSTKTVEAGLGRVGRVFLVRIWGSVGTTGSPTLQIRIKLGSVTLADTGPVTVTNATASLGGLYIEAFVNVRTVGASATVNTVPLRVDYTPSNGGARNSFSAGANATVDLTAAQTFDVTAQWSVANASNTITASISIIDMSR